MRHPSPAIVSEDAARRLPRVALLGLCVAYVVPGFVGRAPWKSADVTAFGVMRELAAGRLGWLDLQASVTGADGLLPYWLGALFIRLLPWLDAATASRVPFALMLGLALAALWYAVYHLARHPAAQPVAFAFGGEAHTTDYARALADGAVLALLACLGLAQIGHETTPNVVQLGLVALLLYGASAAWWGGRWPLVMFALAMLGLMLSAGLLLSIVLGLSAATLLGLHARGLLQAPAVAPVPGALTPPEAGLSPGAAALALAAITLGLAGAAALAIWAGVALLQPDFAWPGERGLPSLLRLLVWFTWPAWPLSLWALWRWRRQIRSAHVALPLVFAIVIVGDALFTPAADRALLAALPALAALAAFALPTLHRSVTALIDWFTLLFFSGCGLVIWVIWLSLHTGVPAKPAANVARLAPGFVPEFSAGALLLALLATLAWLWLVAWRAGRHRSALWKSLALPAGGAVWCWVLLMTLWLPMLDYARSYAPLSQRLASYIEPSGRAAGARAPCVWTHGLSTAQAAGLAWHGGWPQQVMLAAGGAGAQPQPTRAGCDWLLVDRRAQESLASLMPAGDGWRLVAQVRRPADKDEAVLLYRRASAAAQ